MNDSNSGPSGMGAIVALVALLASVTTAASTVKFDALEWTRTTNGSDLPWAEADRHCRDLELGGRTDWRLPTLGELELLHERLLRAAATLEIDGCCLWSSTSLAAHPSGEGGEPGGPPNFYYWGMIIEDGVAYYSFQRFEDGRALCVRDQAVHQ